jgi:hypothetical protein
MFTFHFKSDAPIELDALFFVGEQHQVRAVPSALAPPSLSLTTRPLSRTALSDSDESF